jgi:hypothetical protein
MSKRTLISLTTIPSRIAKIEMTIKSLCLQSAKVDKIRIYIPKKYERFTKQNKVSLKLILDNILDLDPRIEIIEVLDDIGPLSKVAFAVTDPTVRNDFDRVIFVDDDQIYDPKFVSAFEEDQQYCLTQTGTSLNQFTPYQTKAALKYGPQPRFKGLGYRFKRIMKPMSKKPSPWTSKGFVDLVEGWGGVCVNPRWFDDEFIDIPHAIKRADDVWISGYLESRGIGILVLPNCNLPEDNANSVIDSLKGEQTYGQNPEAVYKTAVDICRQRWGIWK